MVTLKDLVEKKGMNAVSVQVELIKGVFRTYTHIKGMDVNSDVEVPKGSEYFYLKGKKWDKDKV